MLTYKIQYWDEFEEETKVAVGIVPGTEFEKVIPNLYSYYGKNNIDRLELGIWEDSDFEVLELEHSKEWGLIDLPELPLEVLL